MSKITKSILKDGSCGEFTSEQKYNISITKILSLVLSFSPKGNVTLEASESCQSMTKIGSGVLNETTDR